MCCGMLHLYNVNLCSMNMCVVKIAPGFPSVCDLYPLVSVFCVCGRSYVERNAKPIVYVYMYDIIV